MKKPDRVPLPGAAARRAAALLAAALLAAGCATAPKTLPTGADGEPSFAALPPGGVAYLWADVRASRDFLDAVVTVDPALLDRTTTIQGGFYPEDAAQRFFLAARGRYPTGAAGFSLAMSRDWKLAASAAGGRYWFNRKAGLGLALGAATALVSSGDPFAPGGAAAPEDFEAFRRGAILAGWLVDPAETVTRYVETLGLPFQVPAEEFFFGLDQRDDGWVLLFRARFPTESQAGAFAALFSLARFFAGGLGGGEGPAALLPALFAGSLEQDGAVLSLSTRPLDAEERASLTGVFSGILKETPLLDGL